MKSSRRSHRTIGIAFLTTAPSFLERCEEPGKHCHFVGRSGEGGNFYISSKNINCPLAQYYLGIKGPDIKELAAILVGWDDAVDASTGLKYLKAARRMEQSTPFIAYFTLPDARLDPDIVIEFGTPDEIQKLVHRYSALTGRRVRASLSGIGGACGECTAYPLVTGEANVSVGCHGSRPRIMLGEDQLLLAAPFNSPMAEKILENRSFNRLKRRK